MTNTTPVPVTLSQILGPAARKSNAVLARVLDQAQLNFEGWVCLNVLAATGPASTREAFIQQASARFELPPQAVADAVSQLESRGLVATRADAGAPLAGLTTEGEAFFRDVRHNVDAVTAELLADIDQADLNTAAAVLQTLVSRAPSILARWEPDGAH
jgi:DNA-binding MarR family transcriptional regulator